MVRPRLGIDGYLEGIASVSKTTDLGLEVLGSGSRVCKRFSFMGEPVLGSCRIDPTGEIAKDTNVCISCDGMDLNKRPVVYRFQQKINEKLFTFATSSESKYRWLLPYVTGDFELCVGVNDNMGSINERCFVSLYFKTETSNDAYAKLEGIFNGTDHVLSDSLTTSDPNKTSVTVQSLSRLIKDGKKIAKEGIRSAKSSITLVISERMNEILWLVFPRI
ncbi:hypothetical protein TSMEX_004585 [Taenia solium]|eukprot:TsM_001233600 transcript=TsM_001233600 gene=TsM_001233600